ncbi:MAG: hypothetical protein AAGL10_15005 [Pseudomonadota bacterium]
MFKFAKLMALLGVAALGLVADHAHAHAQSEYIERGHLKLENTSNGRRKFCIRPLEDWRLFLRKCYTLEAGEWVIFKRREPNRGFKLALYEVRRGPDRVIRDGQLSRDTVYVRTRGENGWAQSSYRPRPRSAAA